MKRYGNEGIGVTMEKSLDRRLKRILSDPSCNEFILADAKDADMAMGLAAPGRSPEHHSHEARFRTLDEYRQLMRDVVKQGLMDIMLMSPSSNEVLAIREGLFENSHVTPAARANDTTDIWLASGSRYAASPSRPFRSATIDQIMCGKPECETDERSIGADLGLYSVTFNNNLDTDYASSAAYKAFRDEAASKGFRHFLEVFDPNACGEHCPADLARFINDNIARILAGAVGAARPLFLKIAYHGPAAMETLAGYDRSLVVGILGGSAGTTFDAYHLLWEAKKYGARVALFGRKINNAEHQLTFIKYLRAVADDQIRPAEAVKAYHAELATLGIAPYRSLENDLQRTEQASAYGGSSKPAARMVKPAAASGGSEKDTKKQAVAKSGPTPDFSKMTQAEKVAWSRARLRA